MWPKASASSAKLCGLFPLLRNTKHGVRRWSTTAISGKNHMLNKNGNKLFKTTHWFHATVWSMVSHHIISLTSPSISIASIATWQHFWRGQQRRSCLEGLAGQFEALHLRRQSDGFGHPHLAPHRRGADFGGFLKDLKECNTHVHHVPRKAPGNRKHGGVMSDLSGHLINSCSVWWCVLLVFVWCFLMYSDAV